MNSGYADYKTQAVLTVDIILRFMGLGLLTLIAIQSVPKARFYNPELFLALSAISVGGLFVGLTPDILDLPFGIYATARTFDIPHLIFVWLFCLSLFDRDFVLRPFHVLVGISYCIPIVLVRLAQFDILEKIDPIWVLIANLFTGLLVGHLIYSVLKGRADDLSDRRRRSRVYFILAIGFIASLTAIGELFLVSTNNESLVATLKTVVILPGVIWISIWLLKIDSSRLGFEPVSRERPQLTHRESELETALNKLMIEQKVYLDEDLRISGLAKKLGVSEPRLRELINHRLGYQNFSKYLNTYRIAAVKAALQNREYDDVPILNIALESGFASLSPFNRAFMNLEGITPSEYRNRLKTM